MYIFKNISNKNVLILDLGLVFYPGEVKDLDLYFTRTQLENSKHLKYAYNGEEKLLQITHKDEVINDINIDKLVQERIDKIVKNQQSIDDVHKKIDILLNTIDELKKSQSAPQFVQNIPQKEEEKVDNIVEDQRIVDIHSRSIKRISKDVSGSVNTEETKKDSDIDDRVDELEGLI